MTATLPRTWIATFVVIAATLGAREAHADGKNVQNEIRAVTFDEDGATTRVNVRGAATPTFTVYKLERPSRVDIDVPQARLAEALRGHEGAATFTPSTWAVSAIAAQQVDDGGQVVRVIVTLARPGRYDVKTEGNNVVVMVTARDPAPKPGVDPKQAEALASAKAESASAKAEADRLRQVAAEQAARAEAAQRAADEAKRAGQKLSAAERERAEAAQRAAQVARDEAARAKAAAEAAQRESGASVAKARAEAEQAKRDAERARNEIAKATDAAARTKAEADAAKADAARMKAEAQATRLELEAARREAAQRKAEADAARVARMEAEAAKAEAARRSSTEVEAAKAEAARIARLEIEAAKAEAARARDEASTAKAQAARAARAELEAAKAAKTNAAKSDAARVARAEADAAKAREEARLARAEAEAAREAAAMDKQRAEAAKAEAAKTLAEAKTQLATLEKRTQSAQAMEDKARAAHAAAQAREEAARETVARAAREREAAEQAVAKAAQARDRASSQERSQLVAEAKAAEERLAKARRASACSVARRIAAETAASSARTQLETTRTTLASVEQQRTAAEQAAREAARLRGEAEAAASDAKRRRTEAETAAELATRRRTQAEQQRTVAEAAARGADKQREVAETAARKAEAKAQAAVAAAQARQVGEAELAKVRREAERLATERKRAEDELADRRKAVASQQAQAERLRTEAAKARDAAEREEQRRSQLAAQRVAEEQALAKLQAHKAAVAAKPVVAVADAKPAFVKDITFKTDAAGARVDIALAGEGKITAGEVTATHAELIIDGAELAAKLERKLDVRKFGSPVRAVSSFRDRRTPNRVRLVAELDGPATPRFDRDATGIRWTFAGSAAPKTARATRTQNIPPTVVGGFGAASTPITQHSVAQVPQAARNRKVYRGAIVDLDYKDAPIHDLLRQLALTGKVNIVVPEGVDAKVSVVLKRVPWDQALEVILASHDLWYRRDGNLIRVASRKDLDAEDQAEAARRESMVKSEAPRTELVPLNYASAADLKTKLEAMKSPKGSIEVDERTNQLIISDVAGNREQMSRLALQLDTQTPQISIEARIVEARSTFLRQIGIQWGGRALMGAAGGNATGLLFPSSIGITGGNEDQQTVRNGVATPSDFAVNLPAATGSGEGGAVGMSLGSVGGNFNINLRLSALEDTGTVRIISAPKITVLNNKEASISQGVSIPISVVSAAGTQTQFVQADLSLKVTPYVSQRDCAIAMNLQVTKNEPDFVNVGARGDPTILRKEAKTSMLVQDGETSVLGGIYTRNSGLAFKKVPFFGDLPVLGWFFKNRRENDDRTEILVFITPKITNKALLRCQ